MEEFESLNSRVPDLQSALAARIASQTGEPSKPITGKIDPYQLMLKKKSGVDSTSSVIQEYPQEDVDALESYCQKVGIVGFNYGKMHPRAALVMLKRQFGNFVGVPLEDRVLPGYEKMGAKDEGVSPPSGRQVLHG